MLDDKDVEKLIGALEKVFPTAKMMKESFDNVATKEQFQSLDKKVDKIDERLKVVEQKLEDIGDLRPRVKKLEEALEIE